MSVSRDSASQRLSSFTFTAYVFVVLAPSICKLSKVSVLEVTLTLAGMGGMGGSPEAATPVLLHTYVSAPIPVPCTRSMLRVTEPPAQTVSVEGGTARMFSNLKGEAAALNGTDGDSMRHSFWLPRLLTN